MTKSEMNEIEDIYFSLESGFKDAIVSCVEDYSMDKEDTIKLVAETYDLPRIFVRDLYKEIYEEES